MFYSKGYVSPRLAGVSYTSDDDYRLPTIPILSIVQLSFQPDVNIHDESQPVARLWEASLEFVSSISGFVDLHWAVLERQPQVVIVLIQWENGIAWKEFQCSVGFSLLLGFLTEGCFNRAVRLSLPSTFAGPDRILELVSFEFPSNVSARDRRRFKYEWNELFEDFSTDDLPELISACGGWMEKDEPDEEPYFAGLLVWKKAENDGPRQWSTSTKVREKIKALSDQADLVISALSGPLHHESRKSLEAHDGVSPSVPAGSTAPLLNFPILKVPVTRRYLENKRFFKNVDLSLRETVEAAQANKRLFPGPCGSYFAMGTISQYNLPSIPDNSAPFAVDVVWFRMDMRKSQISQAFRDLRIKILTLPEHATVRWGRDNDRAGYIDRIALLVSWKTSDARQNSLLELRKMVEDFTTAHSGVVQPPSFQSFHCSNTLRDCKYLELISFYVPAHEVNKRAFEHAYWNFTYTTGLHGIGGSPVCLPACHCLEGSWQDEPVMRGEPPIKTLRYTGVLSWQDPAGREEWYNDFARGARTEYERLGHIVDWLRTLAVGGAETNFLVLERVDPEITAREMAALGLRRRPGKLF